MLLHQKTHETPVKDIGSQLKFADRLWGNISEPAITALKALIREYGFSVCIGDLIYINNRWYVTHSGLLRLARRHRCAGMKVELVREACNKASSEWAFVATVFTGRTCRGFSGYGDANPSNVSPLVHGAEMRVAETRAVNRALRKAYGIGICPFEEIGSFDKQQAPDRPVLKLPPEPANGNGSSGNRVNGSGTRVRDRLCQLIRQHKLDAELVKSYAVDFCATKTLREASREQVEAFVAHLADWAGKDRNGLLCQLNSYQRRQEQAPLTQQQAGTA
jgi:hypothetical protein